MKKITLTLVLLLLLPLCTKAQIKMKWDYSAGTISGHKETIQKGNQVSLTVTKITDEKDFDDFVKNTKITSEGTKEKTLESALTNLYKLNYDDFKKKLTIKDIDLMQFLDKPMKEGETLTLTFKSKSGGDKDKVLKSKYTEKKEEKREEKAQIKMSWDYAGGTISGDVEKIKKGQEIFLTVNAIADVNDFDDFVKNTKIKSEGTTEKTLESAFTKFYEPNYDDFKKEYTITDIELTQFLDRPMKEGEALTLSFKSKPGGDKDKVVISKYTEKEQVKPAEAQTEEKPGGDGGGEDDEDDPNVLIVSSADLPEEQEAWLDDAYINVGAGKKESLGYIYSMDRRYDNKNDRAYIFLDESGNLMGNMPVNIDQDDMIYIIIFGLADKVKNYTVDFIGSYAPRDLQMRSFEKVNVNFKPNSLPNNYMVKVFKRGPFTSETVTVRIKNGKKVLSTYGVRVNKLFHLAFGVGVNITDLEDPEYEIRALDATTNTIVDKNAGKRTIFSINTIWYWRSTMRYLFSGSNITSGRDVLKEPNFLERINPSFGFSLDSNFAENIFFAGNFEFARGGTINIGYHWGRVNRLNINDFELGKTVFTGTTIPQTKVWDGAFFIGIMLDTRIFNQLFSAVQ